MITSGDALRAAIQDAAGDAFVGREAELATLRAQWNEVCLGEPRVVLIEGAAGIGKTALVERFLEELPDATVLRVSGDQSEALIPLAVADQLLRQAGERAALLLAPGAQSRARAEDHVRVGNLILQALDRLQTAGPVAVALDDAHWADAPSLAALLFAVRRLMVDRVLLVVAARDDEDLWIPEWLRRTAGGRRGSALRLMPLDVDELGVLASDMGVELSLHALRRLWGHTEGNPLYARALLGEVPAHAWLEGDELPAPRPFAALVRQRLERRSAGCRALVEAASVLGTGCSLAGAARLAALQGPLGALEEAVDAGLLRELERRSARAISFVHPLIRAAVYTGLSPAGRARLHGRAAALAEDEGAALRHRALAATGPDAGLAAELEAFALGEAMRGAWASAAEDYRTAGALSPAGALREERVLKGLDAMVSAGQVERARRLACELDRFAPSARRYEVLANLSLLSLHPKDAQPLFEEAWRLCDRDAQPALAARIAQRYAVHWFLRLDAERAIAWSARALRDETDGALAGEAHGIQAMSLAYLGRFEEAHHALAPTLTREGDLGVALRGRRGWLRLVQDDIDGAIADLVAAAPAALRCGLLNLAAVLFTILVRAEYAAGAWDDAFVHAERAIAIALEHEHALPAFVWGAAIAVPAARGELQTIDAYVREATRKVLQCNDRTAWIGIVRAEAASARGASQAVLDALAPLISMTPRAGIDEPGFFPWQELYAEALVATGALEEARTFLARHEAIAATRGRHSLLAALARVRGRLLAAEGEPEQAQLAFAAALAHSEQVPMPYQRALIELDMGAALRRNGQRRAAAERLRAAAGRLDSLGARPALQRCEHELAACGLAPARRGSQPRSTLTPPERSVARLVASGMSNREVAAELMVSVKTVEFHLTRIYQCLGVRSRGQLAALLRSAADDPLATEDLEP